MICRKCGKGLNEIGGWLTRVNEKGIPGVWECRPRCGVYLPQETRIIQAIEGEDEEVNKEAPL